MKDEPFAYLLNGHIFWNKESALKYQQPKEWMPDNTIYEVRLEKVIPYTSKGKD